MRRTEAHGAPSQDPDEQRRVSETVTLAHRMADLRSVWWLWRHHALRRWWRVVFMGGGVAAAGKLRRYSSALIAIFANLLMLAVMVGFMAIVTLRLGPQIGYATIAGALAAVVNLYVLSRLGVSLGGAVGTLFDSEDLAQLETMPVSSRHLFAYKLLQGAFLYSERIVVLVLTGVLFGYGLGYVLAEVNDTQVAVVAIALCLVVALVASVCIPAGCTALQMALSMAIVRMMPARRNLFIVVASIALIVGIGALYQRAFGRLPTNPELLNEYIDTASASAAGSMTERYMVMFDAVGNLIGPVFGPILSSTAWHIPPGGWVSEAVTAAGSGQLSAMMVAVSALAAVALAISVLSIVLAGGGYRYARSQTTSGGTSQARGERAFIRIYNLTQELSSNRWGRKLLPPIAAAAFTRELICIGRETKRVIALSGVTVATVSLVTVIVLRQPWARGEGVMAEQLSIVELATAPGMTPTVGWSLLWMALYVLAAFVGWAVPAALGASSVGLDGGAGAVWASQAGGMRQAVRGKWLAYFVIGAVVGGLVEVVALSFVGPFYFTGFGVGVVCAVAFAAASSAVMVGTSALYARFWWDNPADAIRRGSQFSLGIKAAGLLVWAMVAYTAYEGLRLLTTVPLTWAIAASFLLWVIGAVVVAWWSYIRGTREVQKLEW